MFGNYFIENSGISERIHHPLDEGELELHEITLQVGKSRTRHIGRAFLVDPSSNLRDLSVIADWKIKFPNFPPLLHSYILLFGESDWSICGWNIWDFFVESEKFCLHFFEFFFSDLYLLFEQFCFFEEFWFRFPFAHARRELIAFRTQSIKFLSKHKAFLIEFYDSVEVDSFRHFIMESLSNEVRIGTEDFEINHKMEVELLDYWDFGFEKSKKSNALKFNPIYKNHFFLQ